MYVNMAGEVIWWTPVNDAVRLIRTKCIFRKNIWIRQPFPKEKHMADPVWLNKLTQNSTCLVLQHKPIVVMMHKTSCWEWDKCGLLLWLMKSMFSIRMPATGTVIYQHLIAEAHQRIVSKIVLTFSLCSIVGAIDHSNNGQLIKVGTDETLNNQVNNDIAVGN